MFGIIFGIIMFISVVPALWISFFYMYPAKWQNRKLILGLNNREEFRTAPAADEVERIVTTARRRRYCA